MKKLTALLLTLVLALSLTACGSNESKQLVGTWQCTVDITSQMDTEIGGALDAEYASETPMQMFLTAVFNDDGTFTMGVDTDATAASFTAYIQALKPVIVELTYQEAEKQGMTREEYDKALDGSGLTVEGLVDSVLSAFDVSALLGDIGSDITAGSYKAEKGRLYLSENGSGFKAEESVGYALSGGTMTWSDDNALLSELESMGISSSLEWVKQEIGAKKEQPSVTAVLFLRILSAYSPMGAPQWGQNLSSLAAPQTGQTLTLTVSSSAAGSTLAAFSASSSAMRALEALTAATTSLTASGVSPVYSEMNHSPMAR